MEYMEKDLKKNFDNEKLTAVVLCSAVKNG